MERIKDTDTRDVAIKKFDDCMEELFSISKRFLEDIKRVGTSGEHNNKIYTLGYNYCLDVKVIAGIVEAYSLRIKNSMLSIRMDKHGELLDRMEKELYEVRLKAEKIERSQSAGIDANYFRRGREEGSNDLVMPSILEDVSNQMIDLLSDKGYLFFGELLKDRDKISKILDDLCHLSFDRNDNDYEVLYDSAKEEYYMSDLWEDLKNGYITQVERYQLPEGCNKKEKLLNLISSLSYDLSKVDKVGCLYDANSGNRSKLSRELIKLNYDTYDNINKIFETEGKIAILEDWLDDLRYEELPYEEALEEYGVHNKVVFIEPVTEEIFMKAWPELKEYVIANKDCDEAWCCLHHTLSFYRWIEETRFTYFMSWLNGINGEDLIKKDNARRKMFSYFVQKVKTKWSEKELEEYADKKDGMKWSEQLKTKYRLYCGMVCEIREILLRNI